MAEIQEYQHYHQLPGECFVGRALGAFRDHLGRLLGLNVNWTELTQNPLEGELEPLGDWGLESDGIDLTQPTDIWEAYAIKGRAIMERARNHVDGPDAA